MKGVYFDGTDLHVTDALEVRPPRPHEVAVRVHHAGLCHSDVSVIDGTIPFPQPVVLGHEGAGVVEAVGDAVTKVKIGDHVVLTTLGNCGRCAACDRGQPTMCRDTMGRIHAPFTLDGERAFQFANTGVFAEHTVVAETQAVVIDPDVPLTSASLVGCAVITGVGAVWNRAKVTHGQTVVVIGLGGIGLNVVQAASLANASRVIAVDTNPDKEAVARQFGATDVIITGPDVDLVEAVKERCPNGVDHAFECVGHATLIRTAIDLLDWGGTCVLLGVPKLGTEASFTVAAMYNDKSILGCRYGSARPHHDIAVIIDLYRQGRLLLDELVSRTYPLDDIRVALDDLHGGRVNRGVLDLV
ncbi:zinc-dependent alcohol dehydrogenase family protein [soil metagenome]